MKEIPLTRGMVAIVDDEDYVELSKYHWCSHNERHTCYALRHAKISSEKYHYGVIRMHRAIITDVPSGMEIDHINGNGLDNRRENLRVVTRRENLQNLHINKSSKYPGVCWDKPNKKWRAQIRVGGQRNKIFLGNFDSEEMAAFAYMYATKKVPGLTDTQSRKLKEVLLWRAD